MVIVGAGPTGLALGALLAARQVPVTVLEAKPAPDPQARASHLHGRALELLEGTGAVPALLARGRPTTQASVYRDQRRLTGVDTRLAPTPYPFSLALPQPEVEAILAERLVALGGSLRRGVRVTSLEDGLETVAVQTDQGHLTAGWVVGCDGANSTVREGMGSQLRGAVAPRWMALVDADGEGDGQTHLHVTAAGPVLRVGLRDGWRVVICGPTPPAAETVLGEARARLPGTKLPTAVRWGSPFRLHRLVADRWRVGRLLLAGDAAHLQSPFGGHGMNNGLIDAGHLAWRLALVCRGKADPALLDRYAEERRAQVTSSVWQAWWGIRLLLLRGGPLGAARDLLFQVLSYLPGQALQAARWGVGLDADEPSWITRWTTLGAGRVGGRFPDRPAGEGWLLDGARGHFVVRGTTPPADLAAWSSRLGEAVLNRPGGPVLDLITPDGRWVARGAVPDLDRALSATLRGAPASGPFHR